MMKFTHVKTGEIMNVNPSHSVYEVLKKSPSWKPEKASEEPVERPAKSTKKGTRK